MTESEKEKILQQARQYVEKWRPYLRLSDWRVELAVISSKKIRKEGGCGCAIATHCHHERAIRIELGDELGKCIWKHDLEGCIIHEMKHAAIEDMSLHSNSIQANKAFIHMIETICNDTTFMLLKLDREKRGKDNENRVL